jgi:hypothetical protein
MSGDQAMIEGGARKIRHERAFINGWKVKIKAAAFDSHIRQVSTGGKAQGGRRDRELDTSRKLKRQTVSGNIESYADSARIGSGRFLAPFHRSCDYFVNRFHAISSMRYKALRVQLESG